MVKNQKIARLAEKMEKDRQDRELRKMGVEPARAPKEEGGECCCDAEPKLPPGWKRHWSKEHAIYYYHHKETARSTWKKPTEVPPAETVTPADVTLKRPANTTPIAPTPESMDAGSNKAVSAEELPPEPETPPTARDKARAVCDEVMFSIALCFCWGAALN